MDIVGNLGYILICNGIWVLRVYNIFLMTQNDHISTLNVNNPSKIHKTLRKYKELKGIPKKSKELLEGNSKNFPRKSKNSK